MSFLHSGPTCYHAVHILSSDVVIVVRIEGREGVVVTCLVRQVGCPNQARQIQYLMLNINISELLSVTIFDEYVCHIFFNK